VLGYLLVAAPMIAVAVFDPHGYFGRGATVTPFGSGSTPLGFLDHVLRTIATFGITGDPNERHNAAALPLLSVALTLLAALGAWRAWRHRADPGMRLLLLGVPVFLLPPLVAVEGDSPHFLRFLGMAPYLAGLLGLGAVAAVRDVPRLAPEHRRRIATLIGAAAAGAALVAATVQGGVAYFGRSEADVYWPYSYDLVALAEIAAQPGTTLILDEANDNTVRFIAHQNLPRIVRPGTRLDLPTGRIVALRREDIASVLGAEAAAGARPAAFDPQGQPAVVVLQR
jgi:hypothetical protein